MTLNPSIEQRLAGLNEQELRRLLIEQHASQRLTVPTRQADEGPAP